MLVLSRKRSEEIFIQGPLKPGQRIRLVVVELRGDKVRLGVEAPPQVDVLRDDAVVRRPPRHDGRKLARMVAREG